MKSVLIGTPAYAGLASVPYLHSIMAIRDEADRRGIKLDCLVTSGESHVTRARNNICATFLNTDYDVLAFIDADIEISAPDFFKLVELDGVRGAAVACKTPDFSEMLSLWVDGKRPRRAEMPSEPFSVHYLGSAVLLIDRAVLLNLTRCDEVSEYRDPIIGKAWDFFRDGVEGDHWDSEDHGFCSLCRSQGIEITCDPRVVVTHYGTAGWRY